MKKWYILGIAAGSITAILTIILNFKKILSDIVAVVILSLAILGILLEPAEKTIPISYISKELRVDVSAGTVQQNQDTHGGFLGDGHCVVELSFSHEDRPALLAEIQKSSFWKPLPLTQNLTYALYGGDFGDGEKSPYFDNEDGQPFLPEVENGYYFFLDRHSESTHLTDDAPLFSRASYNFTLAIFDLDTNTLYYFEMDT